MKLNLNQLRNLQRSSFGFNPATTNDATDDELIHLLATCGNTFYPENWETWISERVLDEIASLEIHRQIHQYDDTSHHPDYQPSTR